MKINLNRVLVDLAGGPLQESVVKRDENGVAMKDENGKLATELVDVTLNKFAANALLHPTKEEEPEDKAGKYLLAVKIYPAEEIELSVEELALIKRCVSAPHIPTIAMGQAWEMLDPKES